MDTAIIGVISTLLGNVLGCFSIVFLYIDKVNKERKFVISEESFQYYFDIHQVVDADKY